MRIPSGLRDLRRRRPVFVPVALVVLAWFLAYPAVDVWLRAAGIVPEFRYWDFGAYGSAIVRLEEGRPLYEQAENGGYFGTYLYPPATLLVFEPFIGVVQDAVGYPTNRLVWSLTTTGLFVLGVQLVASECFDRIRWWHRGVLAWATVGFQPVLLGFKMGQTPALMSAMLCFSFVGLARQGRGGRVAGVVSGAFMGVVGFFKLAYAPTGAHLLADRRRFAGAVVTGLALVGLSVAVYGVDLHLTYLEVLEWGLTDGGGSKGPTLGGPPYFKPLYWLPGDFALRVGASLAIAGLAIRSEASDETLFALGVAAFPLLTTLAYVYYFVALVPAALVVLAGELRRDDGHPVVPVLGLWLLSLQTLYTQGPVEWVESFGAQAGPVYPFLPVLQPGLWGCLLVAGLAFVRAAQETTAPARVRHWWRTVRARIRRWWGAVQSQ